MSAKPIEPTEVLNKAGHRAGVTEGSRKTQFGASQNPRNGGLTSEAAHLRTQMRVHAVSKAHAALERLEALMNNSDDDEVCRKAACDILSYALGKPTTMVEVDTGQGATTSEVRSITVTVVRHGSDE